MSRDIRYQEHAGCKESAHIYAPTHANVNIPSEGKAKVAWMALPCPGPIEAMLPSNKRRPWEPQLLEEPSGSQSKWGLAVSSLSRSLRMILVEVSSLHPAGQQVLGDQPDLHSQRGP